MSNFAPLPFGYNTLTLIIGVSSLLRIHQRLIYKLAGERPHLRRAAGRGTAADVLDHTDHGDVVDRVEPEPRAVRAAPVERPFRFRGFRRGRIQHDREIQPE